MAEEPAWPLDLEILGVCGNGYQSLEFIRDGLSEDHSSHSDSGILGCLRELQAKGWIDCFRYHVEQQDFLPIAKFTDEEERSMPSVPTTAKYRDEFSIDE